MADEEMKPDETDADEAQSDDRAQMLAQARALLESEGHYVLTDDAFGKVKAKAAKPLKSELDETKAELERLREEREELARYKAEAENEGKSKAELLAEQLKQSHEEIKAREAEIERIRQEREAERETRRRVALDVELTKHLKGTEQTEAALVWAKSQIPGLSVDDDGQLIITKPSGMDLEGDEAKAALGLWWEQQTFLHSAKPSGPPTSGSRTPPKPRETKFDPRQYSDLNEMLRAAEEANAAKGRN